MSTPSHPSPDQQPQKAAGPTVSAGTEPGPDVEQVVGRPWGADAAASLLFGAMVPAILLEAWVVAGALLVASGAVLLRYTRRRGRITDDKAVLAHFGVYALYCGVGFVPVTLLAQSRHEPWVQTWWVLALSALVPALAIFGFLRADERYQARRRASGDYRSWDIT